MDAKEIILNHFDGNWAAFYSRFVTLPTRHNDKVMICSPLRDDDVNPSFEITLEGQYAGTWTDFGTDERGNAFSFYARLRNLDSKRDFSDVLKGIADEFGIPISENGQVTPERVHVRSLAERGISEATAKAFQVVEVSREKTVHNKTVTRQITFPICDRAGERTGTKTHKLVQTRGSTSQVYPWKALEHDTIYLINGEPGVWRCWEAEYRNVLCGTGGEGTFKQEWVEHFRDKAVRLVLDNDDAGRKGTKKIAAMLHGVATSLELVQWPGEWREKGDIEDWLNAGHRLEDLEFETWEPTAEAEEWPEPQPLPDALPPVEPFVPDLLPAVFQQWICDIAERMQCPPDFSAVGAMVALAAVVDRQVAIRPKVADDWQVVPNLWGGVVGRPGLLKTPALGEVMRPLDRLEAHAREGYEAAQRDFEAEKLVREVRQGHAKDQMRKALRAGEDPYQAAEDALIAEEMPPTRQRYRTNDPTMEKLGELLNENPRGLLLFRDELTGFLRTLDREGRESDRAFYLEAWNGTGQFVFDRIGRGTIDIQAACISILGGIQPGPLSSYMGRAARGGQDDDGLVQRFQLVVWPDPPGTWQNIDRPPDVAARQRAFEVFERLDRIDPATIGAEVDDDGFLPFLRFTPEAQEIFTEWRTELEHRLRDDDLHPMLEAHLAKFRSLIPSLALLIHLADIGSGPVDKSSLVRACAWGEYLESHAQRVYAPSLSPSAAVAGALAKRICRGDLGTEFALHDVYRKGWSGLCDREEVQAGLELLEDLDWVRKKVTPTPGRPKTRYLVNPHIGEG